MREGVNAVPPMFRRQAGSLAGQTLTQEERVWSNSHQAFVLHTQQQRIKLCIMHNGSATAVFCTQAMCRLSIVCKHSVTATGLVAPHSNIRPWFGDRFVLHGTIKPNGF